MIIDKETNFLYLPGDWDTQYDPFFERFLKLIGTCSFRHDFLRHTKDIWARDYMPAQLSGKRFVQFRYDPGYLHELGQENTITDPGPVCGSIGIKPATCNLKLDGGNIVKWKDKAIITEKVYDENPKLEPARIRHLLREKLEIDQLIMIPPDPDDFTGHADGMVRFLDSQTVLVNDFISYETDLKNKIKHALQEKGLRIIPFPYRPSNKRNKFGDYTAEGCYINFLWIGDTIIIPEFGLRNEHKTKTLIQDILDKYDVLFINCAEIIEYSGALHCLGWNILKT